MSRRRYISTEISLDRRINRLALEAGDFATLLYTWMIPHAEDDASITADPEELLFRICPGRRDKSRDDIDAATSKMVELELLCREDRRFIFPTDAFYRYQSYIPAEKRRTAKNAADHRKTAKNRVSPSPSPSPSPSLSPKEIHSEIVEAVVSRINDLSDKHYSATAETTEGLRSRLKAGATREDCIKVVEDRWRRWRKKEDMIEHFNPVTLFRKTNFTKYLVEANAALNGNGAADLQNGLMPE